jgi:hypothetical protein
MDHLELNVGERVYLYHPTWSMEYAGIVRGVSEYAVTVMLDSGMPAKVHPSVVHRESQNGQGK